MGLSAVHQKHIFLSLAVFLLLTAVPLSAFDALSFLQSLQADYDNEGLTTFRSLQIPSGGKAEAMGGAFTGLSDDIGFFEYNAAASSLLTETEAVAMHNSWIADSALETVGFTRRNGDFGYGIMAKSFYVPFTEYDYFGRELHSSYYTESLAVLNGSYNFFNGYDFRGISLGVNLKGALRTMPDYTDDDTSEIIGGSGLSQSAVAVMADLGMIFRCNLLKFYSDREPNFSAGIALTNMGLVFTGLNGTMRTDETLPGKLAVGIACRMIQPVTVTLEFQQPVNLQHLSASEHWSAGAGMNLQITGFFALQSGFQYKGGNPRFSLGAQYTIADKVMANVNYTYDITSSFSHFNRFSVSLKTLLGDRGRADRRQEIDDYYLLGIEYYIQGDLDMAIEVWERALLLNRRYDPVKKALQAARDTRRVEQIMIDLQKLD